MPITTINGVRIFSEQRGEARAPLVLVHGSWGDHHNWDAVVPALARAFRLPHVTHPDDFVRVISEFAQHGRLSAG